MRLPDRFFAGRRATLSSAAATLLALAAPLGACQAQGSNLPPLPPLANTAYTLGPGDQVRVITFGEQTLTGDFSVEDSGQIAVPLLGQVQAAGLTTRQLGEQIGEQLRSKKLFNDPSVSVEIVTYRPIFVLGEVAKPGQFPYQPGMTVLAAVAIAGGFTPRAVETTVAVVRATDGKPMEARAGRDSLLAPGDVVNVFERKF